jgi:hypothetical protein
MISWWSKHVGMILSVLMCDIWINVLLHTSSLVGPLHIVPFVRFGISSFFKISYMTKGIYFKDTIPTATTKRIFRRNFVIEKGRWRKWIVETNRAKYTIWRIIFSYLDRAVNRKEHYVGFMIHPIFQPRFMSLHRNNVTDYYQLYPTLESQHLPPKPYSSQQKKKKPE